MSTLSIFFAFSFVLLPLNAQESTMEDRLFEHETNGVKVQIFLPGEIETYRGLLLHVANYRMNPPNRWSELARELDFGHVVMSMNMSRNNRPRILREALIASLPVFAETAGHPEIAHLPLVPLGHSAGGMGMNVMANLPDRMLTSAIDCSWVGNSEQLADLKHIPLLFTLGAIPDGFNMIPAIEERFEPARADGFLYGLGFEWDKAHTFANAGTLFAQWIKSVAVLRLPEEIVPGEAIPLVHMNEEQGWLGDRDTWDTTFATIAPWDEYTGDKSSAVWLPDRATAYVWRAYQTRTSPVHLTATTADGQASLGEFRPRREFQLMADIGRDITLGVSFDPETTTLKRVIFYQGDQRLGEVTEAPWQWTWSAPPQGAHAVFARYETADETPGSTNPGLLILRKPAEIISPK
ncbi:MAG: hypothetical protein JJU29_11690 [Verrucomicrobia bacterium]|nr:hypothetical protein [Verrucomicrobiota bacterium]MCH8510139.1 hypothetical protein [Kiritimatiellia bacterium]